ncbi:MAG: permease-like cell division protein FtsX [Candidatus Microsaccharimonas sp.]
MAKGKKKLDSKSFAQQKRHRRQWVTFMRMCRYGVNNFTRNAWLTIAATAVMTITLFVIFTSVMARNVLTDTLTNLRETLQMSIYLDTSTSSEDVQQVRNDIEKLSSVLGTSLVTPEQAREQFIDQNKTDADSLTAIKESSNKFPWTINIKVTDINDTSQLSEYVTKNEFVQERLDANQPPSFAGSKKGVIDRIAGASDFAQKIGIGTSAVFVVISMLIIFNTIRMAIFNRKEEINMMKLIGAERSFIRGPFVVEAVVYGLFAALIATGLGYGMMFLSAPSLGAYFLVQPTLDVLVFYSGFILLAMIVIGAIIGIISSLMATRRYLKL